MASVDWRRQMRDLDILGRWQLIAAGKRPELHIEIEVHPSEPNTWIVRVEHRKEETA